MQDTTTAVALPQELDFQQLPSVLEYNQQLAQRAVAAMEAKLKELPEITPELDVQRGDNIEIEVNNLRQRGMESEKLNKERRMVFTKRMDEVKSLFTAAEKQILEPVGRLKEWADKWNSEKYRRQVEAQKAADLKIAHDNAKIDFVRHIREQMDLRYNRIVADYIQRMNNKFNTQTVESVMDYAAELAGWTPDGIATIEYNYQRHPLLTGDEMGALKSDTEKQHIPVLSNLFVEKVTEERTRLVELAPSRKSELERIATDEEAAKAAAERLKKEEQERAAALAAEDAKRKELAEQEANTAKLNSMFESAAVAPSVQVSKGTSVKQKYNPTTHKEMIAIIQWWVTNCMNLLTVPELAKKFSFMLTAANKELSKGTSIEGVATVEDVSTRTRKSN